MTSSRIGSLHTLGLGKGRHFLCKLELVCFRKDAFALTSLHRADCLIASLLLHVCDGRHGRNTRKESGGVSVSVICRPRRRGVSRKAYRSRRGARHSALVRCCTDQALPKTGLGTHFSDLSNIC